MSKQCSRCSIVKRMDEFHNRSGARDGKYNICRECLNLAGRIRQSDPTIRQKRLAWHKNERLTNPDYVDRHRRYAAKHYASLHGRASTLFKGAYKRDSGATVSLEHIYSLLEIGICPMTGIAFDLSAGFRGETGRHYNPYAPSLDQIIAKAGYTNENTRLVIWQYNAMKGEISDTELYLIAKSIVTRKENANS